MEKPQNCEGMFGSSEAMIFTPACTGGNSMCQNCPDEVREAYIAKSEAAYRPTPEEVERYNQTDWGTGRTLVGNAMLLDKLKKISEANEQGD